MFKSRWTLWRLLYRSWWFFVCFFFRKSLCWRSNLIICGLTYDFFSSSVHQSLRKFDQFHISKVNFNFQSSRIRRPYKPYVFCFEVWKQISRTGRRTWDSWTIWTICRWFNFCTQQNLCFWMLIFTLSFLISLLRDTFCDVFSPAFAICSFDSLYHM